MFLEKQNQILVKIPTSVPYIHLPDCLEETRTLKMTPSHIKINIKDDKQEDRNHKQTSFLPPSNSLVATPLSHFLFFSPPFFHSPFHFSFSKFCPLLTQLLTLQASKATTYCFFSNQKSFDFSVASVISRGNKDFCPPSICTPVQLLGGNRALSCLQWELQEN